MEGGNYYLREYLLFIQRNLWLIISKQLIIIYTLPQESRLYSSSLYVRTARLMKRVGIINFTHMVSKISICIKTQEETYPHHTRGFKGFKSFSTSWIPQ